MTSDPQLDMFEVAPDDPNVEWLVDQLRGRDWLTAAELLKRVPTRATTSSKVEDRKRWLRALAHASGGRVAGGQRGYKLVAEMTNEEYNHWRNWMKRQADEMTGRILEADKVFYRRNPVRTGHGILTPDPKQ